MIGAGGDVAVAIGERIRRARIAADITQADLAKAVRLSRPSITNAEAGVQHLTVTALITIASTLGVTVAALIGEAELNLPPRVKVSAGGWIVRCDECGLVDVAPTRALANDIQTGHLIEKHDVARLDEP